MPLVAINQISIGLNRRALKDKKVAELMESIQTNGLLNPITLDRKLNLIAGLHRLTACKLLGFDQIECNIILYEDCDHTRLAEIDENLIRSELDALERAELWLERDQILDRLGLRAKPGDNQYTHKGGEIISPPPKTTLELAKEAGYTERTFQQGKQIAKSIVPEVKQVIKNTPIAKSTTVLLKVARAGSEEHQRAKQAEKAAQEAQRRQEQEEAQRQTKLAAQARAKQKELQLIALKHATAHKEAKLAVKKVRTETQQQQKEQPVASTNQPRIQLGDEWILERHLIYCGDTASDEFINLLPGNAALAIATPSSTWNHDYLVDEARVVAVLRSEGYIHKFCTCHQMPFRFELMLGNIYVAIFSHQSISKPQKPIRIEGVEGIVTYLVSLYTNLNNFVIAPFLGQGEALITCEKMGRICFSGAENPELVNQAIARWQKWTGKQAEKTIVG
ncbi:MAG TPA: ParB N-terminal domain-containing protein [Coleofasciculaceae cyanobacterium]